MYNFSNYVYDTTSCIIFSQRWVPYSVIQSRNYSNKYTCYLIFSFTLTVYYNFAPKYTTKFGWRTVFAFQLITCNYHKYSVQPTTNITLVEMINHWKLPPNLLVSHSVIMYRLRTSHCHLQSYMKWRRWPRITALKIVVIPERFLSCICVSHCMMQSDALQ